MKLNRTTFKVIFVYLFILTCGCSNSKTTDTESSVFKTKQEKIKFLKRYLSVDRTYKELDFHIIYRDNSTGFIPGPSDWDICLVAKVPQVELELWIKGFKKVKSIKNRSCFEKVPTSINYSKITQWFQQGNSFVGIDAVSGIVVYRSTTSQY